MKSDDEIRKMPLVEQMYNYSIDKGFNVTRRKTYKTAIQANLIDKNGNPTKFALDNELISEMSPYDFMNLDYPTLLDHFYNEYADEQIINDETLMTKKQMYNLMFDSGMIFHNGKPTPRAVSEGMATWGDFIPSLEIQSKMSSKEFVDSIDALHKYSPEHFEFVEKKGFSFDLSSTYDLAKRVAQGELRGDKNSALNLMNHLKQEHGDEIEPL